MKYIVFFIYQGKNHEANLIAGTYRELPPGTLSDRQTVLNRSGLANYWWNWIAADGVTTEVANPAAFGVKIG